MNDGLKLLSSIVKSDKGLEKLLNFNLRPELFIGEEVELFEFVNNHAQKFGAIPTEETILANCPVALLSAGEPPEYYLAQVESRFVHQELKKGINLAVDQLKEKSPEKALELLVQTVQELVIKKHRRELVDYAKDGLKLIKDEYKKKMLLGSEYGINLGWPTLDNMIGGLQPGDVVSIVGRPAMGKTFLLLFAALHAWMQNKVPMFVSMEMKPLLLSQRLAALNLGIPLKKLKSAELSTEMYKKMLAGLQKSTEKQPFWIVDGNMATTAQEIMLLARHLKPDVIFIDGAYLLRSANKKQSEWERVKGTVEEVKQLLASQLNIPVVCSYQFNRDMTKKKQSNVGVEDIGYSDAIGQVSSVVLGLLEEESIETLVEKKVQILKGRSGESGAFKINWLFDTLPFCDFSEKKQKTLEELMFI